MSRIGTALVKNPILETLSASEPSIFYLFVACSYQPLLSLICSFIGDLN